MGMSWTSKGTRPVNVDLLGTSKGVIVPFHVLHLDQTLPLSLSLSLYEGDYAITAQRK